MRKLSLRMRLTLIVLIIITAIALMLTLIAMHNSKTLYENAIAGVSIVADITDVDLPDVDIPDDISAQIEAASQTDASGENVTQGSIQIIQGEISDSPMDDISTEDSMIIAFQTMKNRFDYRSIIFMLIIIAVGSIATYFALGRGLKPVKQLSKEIEGITENELYVRASEFHSKDEISKLADSFNILMERMEKAFSDQKNFSTSAAHELKTPLAAIKSNIDVLEMDSNPTSEEYAQTISVVKKQTERMTNLVDDLFSFSSGDYNIDETVDLSDVIDKVIDDLSHSIKDKDLEINIDSNIGNIEKTNYSILQRVLSNLIENAVKYTEPNGKIHIKAEDESTEYVIKIMDSGPGIPSEYEEKIFQPFFRIDSSRSRKAGGAGLGLAIAKVMAEKICGKISVEANTPKGSIFTLRILKD